MSLNNCSIVLSKWEGVVSSCVVGAFHFLGHRDKRTCYRFFFVGFTSWSTVSLLIPPCCGTYTKTKQKTPNKTKQRLWSLILYTVHGKRHKDNTKWDLRKNTRPLNKMNRCMECMVKKKVLNFYIYSISFTAWAQLVTEDKKCNESINNVCFAC